MTNGSILRIIKNCMPKMRLSQQKTLAFGVEGCLRNPRGKITEIGRGIRSKVQLRDKVKRIYRFLGNKRVKMEERGEELLRWLVARQGRLMPVMVLIDWSREHEQNVLMMSLQWEKRSIPFYWEAVRDGELKGKLVEMERKAIRKLRKWLREERVIVVADRGFARIKFIKELKEQKMEYVIRIPKGIRIKNKVYEGELGGIRLRRGEVKDYKESEMTVKGKLGCRMVIKKEKVKGKWSVWYLATSLKGERKERIVKYYERRMGIEATFRDLKTNLGWRKQERIKESSRIERYLLILVMTMVCALIVSERKATNQKKEIVSLANDWKKTRIVSFVQLGLWMIQSMSDQFLMIHPRKPLIHVP